MIPFRAMSPAWDGAASLSDALKRRVAVAAVGKPRWVTRQLARLPHASQRATGRSSRYVRYSTVIQPIIAGWTPQ